MSLTYNKETNVALFRYTNKEGEAKTLYLGKMPKREADHHEIYLEKILSLYLCPSLSIDPQTVVYLEGLPARLKKTLIKHGLIQPTVEEAKELSMSLGELIDKYLEFHKEDKPNTYKNIKLACDKLLSRFGREKKIPDITPTEINHFEKHLYRDSAEATASRLIKRFRQLMKWAIEQGYFKKNIFESMHVGKQDSLPLSTKLELCAT